METTALRQWMKLLKMTVLFSVTLTMLNVVRMVNKESGTSPMVHLLVPVVMEVTSTETEDQVLYDLIAGIMP